MDYFVETRLAKECIKVLEKRGILVLIGEQGCGKTMIANHIMETERYTNWTKQNIEQENLDTFKPEDNTFLYIDNIFDGYMYEKELYDWWDSLFKFQSQYIEKRKNICLFITIKDTVMKKAGVFIKPDKHNETFFLWADSDRLLLTMEEKLDILQKLYDLASTTKGIDKHFIRGKMEQELRVVKSSIGFPLCAYMYAFEDDDEERDISIFDHTRKYVRNHIKRLVESDKSKNIKALFLLLLFYLHPTGSHSSEYLETYLRDGEKCQEFLQNFSSHKMIEKMNLSFRNLYQVTQTLDGSLLVKHQTLYKFKHHIYLEGVCDYFFQKHYDFVVANIPFDILRICKLHDISKVDLTILSQRLQKDFKEKAFSKVLECDILRAPYFEKIFCNDLRNGTFLESVISLPDETSVFKFPMIFWASKYNLQRMQRILLKLAGKDECLHVYFAMFGRCCADNESYITRIPCRSPEIEQIQSAVSNFENAEGKTILHLLLSSKMMDHDVYLFFTRLLKETQGPKLKIDQSLLDCVTTQVEYSRLICLLEILNRLQGTPKQNTKHPCFITNLIDFSANKSFWGLECLCRICLLVVYNLESFTESTVNAFLKSTATCMQRQDTCLSLDDKMKNAMAYRINQCLQNLEGSCSGPSPKIPLEEIPVRSNMTPDLKAAIEKSIQILATREEKFKQS